MTSRLAVRKPRPQNESHRPPCRGVVPSEGVRIGVWATLVAVSVSSALAGCAVGSDSNYEFDDSAEGEDSGATKPSQTDIDAAVGARRDGSSDANVDAKIDGAAPTDGATPDATTPDANAPDAGPRDAATDASRDGAAPPVDAAVPPVDAAVPDTGTDASSSDSGGTCAATPPSNACGLVSQCGCGTSQTCDVTDTTTGAVSCVSAGSTAAGSACSSTSQCAPGLTCAFGSCRPYCETDGSDCPGDAFGLCFTPTINGTPTPNRRVCAHACNLADGAAVCGAGLGCYSFARGNGYVADCRPAGTRGDGASCSSEVDCRAGFGCISFFLGSECEKYCRIGGNDCGSGTDCTELIPARTIDGIEYGTCL